MAYVPPHRRRQQKDLPKDDSFPALTRIKYIRCINLDTRMDKWNRLKNRIPRELDSIERFSAIDGRQALEDGSYEGDVQLEWDATINSRYSSRVVPGKKSMTAGEVGCALSHILLWRELSQLPDDNPDYPTSMLILEDDALLTKSRSDHAKFQRGFQAAFEKVPSDWGIFYLGFSDRGDRTFIDSAPSGSLRMQVFTPEYGFHTHAYLITKRAAKRLLENLPVAGPIDVWLADNKWFGVPVYCAVVEGEGWKRDDGTYEGGLLIQQDRRRYQSDIPASSNAHK